jgi:steroid delta-isomerase-like uncharacterized protein
MTTEQNKAVVRRVLDEFWHDGRQEVIDELFAPDYVNHDLSGPETRGLDAYKQWANGLRAAWNQGIPDWHVTIEELVAEGDRVAKRWVLRATHTGELLGVAATGRPVTVRAVTIYGFDASGKVKEIWWNYDALGLMQQIGAIPAGV